MDVLTSLKGIIRLLGIRENGKFGALLRIYVIVLAVMLINILCFLINKWNVMAARVIALNGASLVITFVAHLATFTYYWKEFSEMLNIFSEKYFQVPYRISPRRKQIIYALETNMKKFNITWGTMVVMYMIGAIVIPIIIVAIKVAVFCKDFQNVIIENQSAPFPIYYPESIKVFKNMEHTLRAVVYVIGYLFHALYLVVTGFYSHVVHAIALVAMANVELELKLLTQSLVEMDEFIKQPSQLNGTTYEAMHLFQKYFVMHHQYIYRKFNVLTRGANWIALVLHAFASLNICLSVYTIVQEDQISPKLQNAVFFSVWSVSIFVFDVFGERIKTENKKLRNALYECHWLEKPNWFKKSLLIAMTSSCKTFDIKPFGLYGFDFNSFTLTMKAAYCYYNVLCKFKQNNE